MRDEPRVFKPFKRKPSNLRLSYDQGAFLAVLTRAASRTKAGIMTFPNTSHYIGNAS